MQRWSTRTIPAASVFGSPWMDSWRVPFGTEKGGVEQGYCEGAAATEAIPKVDRRSSLRPWPG